MTNDILEIQIYREELAHGRPVVRFHGRPVVSFLKRRSFTSTALVLTKQILSIVASNATEIARLVSLGGRGREKLADLVVSQFLTGDLTKVLHFSPWMGSNNNLDLDSEKEYRELTKLTMAANGLLKTVEAINADSGMVWSITDGLIAATDYSQSQIAHWDTDKVKIFLRNDGSYLVNFQVMKTYKMPPDKLVETCNILMDDILWFESSRASGAMTSSGCMNKEAWETFYRNWNEAKEGGYMGFGFHEKDIAFIEI